MRGGIEIEVRAAGIPQESVEHPEIVGALLREVARAVEAGELRSAPAVPAEIRRGTSTDWQSGTFLITGGLGTLGLSVARWMVEQGARHLVLVGRRGPSSSAASAIKAIEERGASIVVARADVSREPDLAGVLEQVERSGSPLRGIVHAAGVVDDGILLQHDVERFRSVMASKVQGAWNLHTLTAGTPLDFFVMFSSVASFLISAGHGNYAAANAFLDALAASRRSQGLAATTIVWGPWAIGLAAAQSDRLERLSDRGLKTLTGDEGLAALGTLLEHAPERIAVMHFNAPAWCGAPDLTTPTTL